MRLNNCNVFLLFAYSRNYFNLTKTPLYWHMGLTIWAMHFKPASTWIHVIIMLMWPGISRKNSFTINIFSWHNHCSGGKQCRKTISGQCSFHHWAAINGGDQWVLRPQLLHHYDTSLNCCWIVANKIKMFKMSYSLLSYELLSSRLNYLLFF